MPISETAAVSCPARCLPKGTLALYSIFWIEAGTRIGTELIDCPAEALCVAGATPDRAEILLRIVGPRPNGYLWPSLVRFTTGKTEVWIQQDSTGLTRYYQLPASGQQSDTLPGLIDRTGFRP